MPFGRVQPDRAGVVRLRRSVHLNRSLPTSGCRDENADTFAVGASVGIVSGRVEGQPVAHDGEQAFGDGGVAAVALHGLAADEEGLEIVDVDVGPHLLCLLCP
jgi:hypothetical protein